MYDASLHFDHEQHVVTLEQHGVDAEEEGGHDSRRLVLEELGPRGNLSATYQDLRNPQFRSSLVKPTIC